MVSVWSVLKLASRAAIWRTTPDPQPVGLPSLLIWIVVLAALRIALQFVAAGPGGGFNPYGLNAVVAWLALEAAVAALFMPPAARTTALSAMFALLVVAELAAYGAKIGVTLLPAAAVSDAVLSAASFVIFAAVSVWWVGAIVAVLRSCASSRWLPALGRVGALWVALLAVTVIVPHAPVFVGRDFDIRSANGWEALRTKMAAPAANTGKARAMRPLRSGATRASAGGNCRSSSTREWCDQRLCDRPCRLGGPGCFPQGAGRRIVGARRCPADQRAYAASC